MGQKENKNRRILFFFLALRARSRALDLLASLPMFLNRTKRKIKQRLFTGWAKRDSAPVYIRFLVPSKEIRQDSLGLRIRSTGYRILCQWYLDWIPIGRGIPGSLSCIPDSNAKDSGFRGKNVLDSGFHMQKFPGFQNSDSHTRGEL